MAYTTIKKPSDYFNTVLYTGTGAEQSISSLDFSPDLTWIKNRDTIDWHRLLDSVRGATKELYSNSANTEDTQAQSLKSFDSNGFTLGTLAEVNTSGENYASWSWRGSDSSAVSNTDGSITSTVSANTTSGFSIVKFNTSGQSGTMTCGHGLGAVPKMIIVKPYSVSDSWYTYHVGTGNAQYIQLESSNASTSNSNTWASTSPTSSVFSMSTNFWGANTNDIIAYCFAEKKGFSKFGSYTGNGNADGNFVYLGFKPAWVLVKNSSLSGENWVLLDNKRDIDNPTNLALFPNLSDAESGTYPFDFVSNGFKIRDTSASYNRSGDVFIFMAFAENPLVGTNNIPATAR